MSDVEKAGSVGAPVAPVVLFGLDQSGKSHASRFPAELAEQAVKAAKLTGMHVLSLAKGDADSLIDTIALGRIFPKTGSAFVPFVARATYDHLAKIAGVPIVPAAPKVAKSAKATVEKAKNEGAAEVSGKKGKKAAPTPKPEIPPLYRADQCPARLAAHP